MSAASNKKSKKVGAKGVVHIRATFNNTLITITDTNGNTIAWGAQVRPAIRVHASQLLSPHNKQHSVLLKQLSKWVCVTLAFALKAPVQVARVLSVV